MEMIELIEPDRVLYLRSSNKMQLLQDLIRRAAKVTGMPVQPLLDAVMAREALGSTGIGEGIAVPHAKIRGLGRFFALFARLEKPINFDAVDGEPVDLVFLLLTPATADKDHLAALACVARRLRESEVARRLRANTDPAALYEVLSALPMGAAAKTQ
jgi:PTS system nitrogen regulatory IIA component